MKFYEFEIKESKKAVKYLRLKVGQSGEISLSIPLRTKENHILEFLEKNLEWLRKTSAKIKAKNSAKNENQVEFLGLSYELIIDKKASGVSIELFSIKAASKADFRRFCDQKAKELLNASIARFAPLIARPINHISFKHMRTRWGSCNKAKGYINLNLDLITKKKEFIEYVVLHELAHLVYANHSKDFYALISKHMPDYKARIKG
ncbi:MAG: M48 family metallopeptidase [Campylobacter sp.]|uniref:M48 family metallopeptidase n=1 Tax=Campylobacter sp. TaxID=205 RepID=UPI002A9052CF|nr:SprT family zinc-dependent metalloprotease [Campylobacter sp.]MCI7501562.1 M48 family metallopeptidase [Campylobacter sp.]MCI7581637.1 M48 family metallopeptidase [Campylobacter sp.]MCI7587759.1 M48 family metallopeptidase [Campylobacter sp.]MDY4012946.1 SprT family zinc-dependent metalloprotease [Campylobacter sp.]